MRLINIHFSVYQNRKAYTIEVAPPPSPLPQ